MGIITIVLLSFVVFDVDCVQPHVSVKDKLGKILKSAQWNYDHSFLKINKPISIEVISKYTIPAKTTIIKQQYKNCADIKKRGSKNLFPDGVYTIYPSKRIGAVKVYCDMTTEGGGLTVIQRRFDGSTEFFRNWTDYKYGFGDQRKEYWLGNDIIHVLTTNHKQELRIDLQKFSGAKAYAKYAQFAIGDENVKYRLSVSGYKGSAGDGLAYHNGMYFSARDRDNDRNGGYAISHVGGEAFTRFCDRQMDRNDEQIVSPEEGKCTYKCVLTRSLAGSTEMYNTMKRPVRWVAKRLNEAVSPQVAIQKCETHHGEDLDFRCNDCDEFICSSCIKSDHKDHEWDTVKKLAKERRSKVPERCTELRNDLTRQLQNLDQIRAENSKSKKAHLLRVTQMGDEYIEKIKSNTEHMKEKCIENEKSKAEAITKRSEALKKQIKYVNDTISHFEKHKNSMSDRNVIETEKEIDKYISEMTESRSSDFKYSCHIYEGEIAHGPCTHLLGDTIDFYRFSVSKTGEFNTESSECVSIVPKNSNDVMILMGKKKSEIRFYGSDGKLQRNEQVSFRCSDVLSLPEGNILMINYDTKVISKEDASLNMSVIKSTAPLIPIAVCTSNTCGFLVSLVDKYSYVTYDRSERIVQEMNPTGDVLKTHKHLGDDNSFTIPSRLTQNINTDICVVDRTSETTGMLKIIRTRSNADQSIIYNGFNGLKNFDPADVVCDSNGIVIVTDTSNSLVHLLDINGKFMKYLLSDENSVSLPKAMGIYNSSLWIAGAKGVVKVFRYTNNVGDEDK